MIHFIITISVLANLILYFLYRFYKSESKQFQKDLKECLSLNVHALKRLIEYEVELGKTNPDETGERFDTLKKISYQYNK